MKKFLSNIYKIVVKKRNKDFDSGKIKIHKCVSPVISVGNLSIGGSGKTPFVQTLTNIIKELGYKPAIVGRGYKRKSKGEVIVSDGNSILVDAKTAGDEMLLLAESLKVPVVAHEKKYVAALIAESKFNIDCFVIDDGFQHRYLHRDLDILIIDSDTLENPYLLPKGRLREPLEAMRRADIICFLGNISPQSYSIEKYIGNKLILKLKALPSEPYLINIENLEFQNQIYNNINKEKIISVCGIAKPKNFKLMLEALSYNIVNNLTFSDHHNYNVSDINRIINKCRENEVNTIATTEKDAVKLKEFGSVFAYNKINLLVFPIFIKIEEGEEKLKEMLKKILGKRND